MGGVIVANDIVAGLFGLSPYQVQQQQQAAIQQQAQAYAQQDPFQRATQSMYQGGAGLAGIGSGMMGMVNPEVEAAKQREAIMGGNVDMQTPQGLRALAAKLQAAGMTQQAYIAAAKANEMEAGKQDIALKRAQELAALHKAESEASPIAKLSPKDYTSESWAAYDRTGNTAFLRAVDSGEKQPSSVAEYNFAKSQGYAGTFEQWVKDKARASSTTVNIAPQEKGFETELGKGQAEALLKGRAAADDAVEIINAVQEGRNILDKGMVTGFGANFIVGAGQALKQAGVDFGGDATANAQAYTANMAQNVGKLIKQFGAGTGLSDADRQYANKMAGEEIALDEKAIRKILDINEKAARNLIRLQNKRASGVKTNIPLTVDEPPAVSQSWSIRKK